MILTFSLWHTLAGTVWFKHTQH